jgi:tetratricopeptide (TPR) repeat protein
MRPLTSSALALATLALAGAPAALPLAAPPEARAQEAPAEGAEPEVVVVTKDGRRLEGTLLKEDAGGVVIRLKIGAEVPVARAEIQEVIRAAASAGEGGEGEDGEGGGTVETHTVFTLHDDAIVRGRATDRGTYWEVENDLGTVRIEKKHVRFMREEKVVRGAKQEAPAERDEARDLGLGFSVARPSAGWRFAVQAPDPLARVVMRRDDPRAVFRVALAEPLPVELRAPEMPLKPKVQEIISKELKERYRAVRGLQLEIARFHGVPVWRATYQADARVFGSKYSVRELHLSHRDGRIVLQGYCPSEMEAAVAPELEAAFRSFSWIAPRGEAGGEYLDYALGVRIPRPRSEWRTHVRLFDDAVPVELLPADGVGRFRLEVAPAGSGLTPAAAADQLEKTLAVKSRGFRRGPRSEKNLSGVPAVDMRYQDVDGKTTLDVRRLIFVRDQRVIQFVAQVPAPEAGAKPPAAGASVADQVIDGIDSLAEESPLAAARRVSRAVELMVQGAKKLEESKEPSAAIQLLSQALDLAPGYGHAYLVRGKAYADTGDYKRAMKDYDLAGDTVDDPALGKLIATAQLEQAKRVAKEDFPEARKLLLAALRNDPNGRAYKEELTRATLDYTRGLTLAGKFDAAIDELREAERRIPEETRYRRESVRIHLDWARKLISDGELYKARNVYKRAVRLDPENTSIKSMLDRLEQDIKKKEEGDPKKKKGK